MGIDWFTFTAQIVNFLVLVWLLKRFLYSPIVNAMQRREEEISDRLEEAERKRREAEEEKQTYRERNRQWDDEKQQLLEEAREEADRQRKERLEEARREVERKREEWVRSVEQQREQLAADVRHRVTDQIVRVSRRALEQLAGAELEGQLVDNFLQQVDQVDAERRDRLADAFAERSQPPLVRTAFELSEEQQQRIRKALREQFQVDGELRFERSDEIVCGIELQASGHKIGWSVNEFLNSLEEEIQGIAHQR